jgi:hypothetical protein
LFSLISFILLYSCLFKSLTHLDLIIQLLVLRDMPV